MSHVYSEAAKYTGVTFEDPPDPLPNKRGFYLGIFASFINVGFLWNLKQHVVLSAQTSNSKCYCLNSKRYIFCNDFYKWVSNVLNNLL